MATCETEFLSYWRSIRDGLHARGRPDIVCTIADAHAFRAANYQAAAAAYELISRAS